MNKLFFIIISITIYHISPVLYAKTEENSAAKECIKSEIVDKSIIMDIFKMGEDATLKCKINKPQNRCEFEISCWLSPDRREKHSDADVECILFLKAMKHISSFIHDSFTAVPSIKNCRDKSHSDVIRRSELNHNHLLFYFSRLSVRDQTKNNYTHSSHAIYQLWDIKGTLLCLYIQHVCLQINEGKETSDTDSQFEKKVLNLHELMEICKKNQIEVSVLKKYVSKSADERDRITTMTFHCAIKSLCSLSHFQKSCRQF